MAGPQIASSRRGAIGRIGAIGLVVAAVAVLALAGSTLLGGGAGPGADGSPGVAAAGASAGPSARPIPGHEVYGFVPYWEMDGTIADHLATVDATTIALFSVSHGGKGALAMSQNGAKKITGPIGKAIIRGAHDRHQRVDLTYTSFGRTKNAKLFGSEAIQAKVIAGLVALRRQLGMDGIAVDVEEIDDVDIPAYGAFVGNLRGALRADDPDATVTVATGAGRQGAALALAASVAGADRIFLMGYDYRTGSSQPGATAPMERRDGDQRTLPWSLDLYAGLGVPPQKTILGLPLYGVAWPSASRDLGAPSSGKGAVWVPRQNLSTLQGASTAAVYDQLEAVTFLAVPDGDAFTAIYYDTPQSLTPKLVLADDRGLAGAGLWALGYDRGQPAFADLLEQFRTGRLDTAASVPGTLP
jgi:glycosyl hydrolase family 18 (putative chitinase)